MRPALRLAGGIGGRGTDAFNPEIAYAKPLAITATIARRAPPGGQISDEALEALRAAARQRQASYLGAKFPAVALALLIALVSVGWLA